MNIELSEDQALLRDSLEKVFREHSTGARIRAAEPEGFDRALWNILSGQGIAFLRAPEPVGSGGSLMDAVVVCELAGRYLAAVPLAESIVSLRLLAEAGDRLAGLRADCAEGKATVAMALHDAAERPVQTVPGGAGASHVICLSGGRPQLASGLTPLEMRSHGADGSAKFDLGRAQNVVALSGLPEDRVAGGIEEWRILNAARVVGAARRAVEIAAAYACEREAFGRKIGEYQAVSHALADAATDLEGARLLVWRAVERIAKRASDAAACVAMAEWWSGHAARPAALRAMRVFGGYGMAMDYDAQLHFRRVNAWSLLGGPPEAVLHRIADRLWRGVKSPLPDAGEVAVDFDWGEDTSDAVARMRVFGAQRDLAKQERFSRDSKDGFDREMYRELAREGLLYPDYPKDVGGPGLSMRAAAAVYEVQCGEFGWHMLAQTATDMVGKVVYHFGSEEAKREILPKVVAGEVYISLGYTEASNGSDIFAVKTAARRESDAPDADWIISGQKMFTSVGHIGDYSLMITRTAPDKYKGITVFIVPLRQAGYEFTEIRTIGDERTNITFYRDLRVPDRYRIGPVNGGVKVMAKALTLEQSSGDTYLYGMRNMLKASLAWAGSPNAGREGQMPIDDDEIARLLAEVATRIEVGDALGRYAVWAFEIGKASKATGPMAKLFCSESFVSTSNRLLAAMAPDSLEVGYEGAGVVEWLARRSIPGTIYGGTSEVQRSLVAEAGLGLPRTR